MVDEHEPDSSLLELAILKELAYRTKVPYSDNVVVKPLSRSPSFRDWTNTGPIPDRSLQGQLALHQKPNSTRVQSSIELPRFPTSSPRPQNLLEQSPIKNEPHLGELSGPRSVSSAAKDWIGPSRLFDDEFQTNGSSSKVPPLVPFSHEIPTRSSAPNLNFIPRTNSSTNQKPKHFPEPSIPTKTRSSLKRKERSLEQYLYPSPSSSNNSMITKSAENLVCELCQVSCSSALTLQQHLHGRPHKAKLVWMQLKRNCTGKRKDEQPQCNMCQIWCSDGNAMELHLKGQKHKAKLQELELCKKNGVGNRGIVAKQPIFCELCLVNCMNEDLFKMHLEGRQHATRQELKRRGMI